MRVPLCWWLCAGCRIGFDPLTNDAAAELVDGAPNANDVVMSWQGPTTGAQVLHPNSLVSFTIPGSYAVTVSAIVTVAFRGSGGGGGGGSSGAVYPGGNAAGGGGGAACNVTTGEAQELLPNASYTFVVGAGGTGGNESSGRDGAATLVRTGSTVFAHWTGGRGGNGNGSNNSPPGGAGGGVGDSGGAGGNGDGCLDERGGNDAGCPGQPSSCGGGGGGGGHVHTAGYDVDGNWFEADHPGGKGGDGGSGAGVAFPVTSTFAGWPCAVDGQAGTLGGGNGGPSSCGNGGSTRGGGGGGGGGGVCYGGVCGGGGGGAQGAALVGPYLGGGGANGFLVVERI